MRIKRRSTERGAVAVLTAVVVGAVLLAVLALSVDVGGMTLERRQLQNAADATALALAQDCGSLPIDDCDPSLLSGVEPLLGDNSWLDDESAFDTSYYPLGVCARNVGGFIDCDSASGTESLSDLAKCPPVPDWLQGDGDVLPYVETYSRTLDDGSGALLPAFGPDSAATTQVACSRAAWGPAAPATQNIIALTMSQCDWVSQTGYDITQPPDAQPATFTIEPGPKGPKPGYDSDSSNAIPDWPANERAVYSKGNPTSCETSSPGGTAPGGFAWLNSLGGCTAELDDDNWVKTKAGADAVCTTGQLDAMVGTIIYVPVFDCMAKEIKNPIPNPSAEPNYCSSGVGDNTYYHVDGFAAFYLSGYFTNNGSHASVRPPGGYRCGNPDRCLFGWFTKALISPEDADIVPPGSGGTPDYGLTVIKPAG